MVDHFRVADHIGFLLVFGVTRCLKPQRQEIKRIAGAEVQEATAEIETTTDTVVQVFTTGTMVTGVPARSLRSNGHLERRW